MKTKCKNGNFVERWYERAYRSSATRVINAGGNQIGFAEYTGNKKSSAYEMERMIRERLPDSFCERQARWMAEGQAAKSAKSLGNCANPRGENRGEK